MAKKCLDTLGNEVTLGLVLLLVLLLLLENTDVSPSEPLNKIIMGESGSLFPAEAQQTEHEHDSPNFGIWD